MCYNTFQANSKFIKAEQSQPKPRPNFSKKKAWISLSETSLFKGLRGPLGQKKSFPAAFLAVGLRGLGRASR
jgi:hypothetical protein